MTSTTIPTAPRAAVRTARTVSRPLVAGGAVLLALGILAGATAGGVMAAFGPDEAIDSGFQPMSTATAALMTDAATVGDVADLGVLTGTPVLEVSVAEQGSTPVFVGVGPAQDVADYLDGVPVEEVTYLGTDPFRLDSRFRDGVATPGAPVDRTFWSASAVTPSPAEFTWPIEAGDHRIVVMNADGSLGVAGLVRLRVTLPEVFSRALGVLVGSAMVGIIGAAMVTMALRRSRYGREFPRP